MLTPDDPHYEDIVATMAGGFAIRYFMGIEIVNLERVYPPLALDEVQELTDYLVEHHSRANNEELLEEFLNLRELR